MKISKEDLISLVDSFEGCLMFDPEKGHEFSPQIERKIDDMDFVKNNLDKPFTILHDGKKDITETLYEFLCAEVKYISVVDSYGKLGLSKNVYRILLPKNKSINSAWVWDKVNKAQDRSSKVLTDLCSQLIEKLNLKKGLSIYPTSFGVSIECMWNNNAEATFEKIEEFLNAHGVVFRDKYSHRHYVINVVISKARDNIERLTNALNEKAESRYRFCHKKAHSRYR